MKYSTRLSDAVHILALIALNPNTPMTSAALAESVKTNPGFVRQIMSALRTSGLISSTAGKAGAALTRDPSEIRLLDIYKAVEGDKPLLHLDTHTNPDCGVGINIQFALKESYDAVQQAAEERMGSILLQDILVCYHHKVSLSEDPSC